MSQYRYEAARKVEAVRRVVEDGRSVCDVAREFGVSEGSLFFWVRRYREFAYQARMRGAAVSDAGRPASPSHAGTGSLVAYLRRASA